MLRAPFPLVGPLLPSLLTLLIPLTLGCNGTSARCLQPLANYCQGPCQTYDEAVAQLRSEVAPGCVAAKLGTCEGRRFVQSAGYTTGYAKFFDTGGELVGVRLSATYAAFCGGDYFQLEYGEPPACRSAVLTEDLCSPSDGGDGGTDALTSSLPAALRSAP